MSNLTARLLNTPQRRWSGDDGAVAVRGVIAIMAVAIIVAVAAVAVLEVVGLDVAAWLRDQFGIAPSG